MAATHRVLFPGGLDGSSRMCVGAVSGIPVLEGFQVLPPSILVQTPPLYCVTEARRHILGRGRSCVSLITPHILPRTAGSNATQYVVLLHACGTPVIDRVHERPPSSLRKRPISVVGIKRRFASNGSNMYP